MAVIIGGPETGLLDSSFGKLGRDDATSKSKVGHGEEILVNVSSGNLTLTKEDTYLPSLGDDYQLVRTYNSRGRPSDASQYDGARWTSTTSIHLSKANDRGEKYFEVEYGDGSLFDYRLDEGLGLYVSTDGAGAYETLQAVNAKSKDLVHFIVTRSDQTKLSFDKQGNLVLWEDPNGVGMTYTYKSNRLVKVEDDDGHVIEYNFAKGRLVSVTDEEEGVLVEYRYSKGRLSEVVDREGSVTKYFYTNDGFVNRIVLPADNGDEKRELKFEYQKLNVKFPDDDGGQSVVMTKMTDAEGKVTQFDYNFKVGKGRAFEGGTTIVTDAAGETLAYTYDVNGYIIKVVDQRGETTRYVYDADGNVTEVIDRRGFKSTFEYDDRGNPAKSTDNSGNTTTFTYNEFNKLTSVQTAEGETNNVSPTEFFYDDKQNLLKQVDPSGDVTQWEYDELGNQTRRTVFLGAGASGGEQVTQYFYDAYGNNIQTIDAENNVTRSTYDHFGNVLQTIAYVGETIVPALTLDVDGLLDRAASDANDYAGAVNPDLDQVTTYTYDEDNRLLSVVDPEGFVTTNTYDAVGNVTAFQDARGSVTTYIYDRNNRLLDTIEPASANAEARETTRSYDVVGNETSFKDAEGRTVTYTYSARRELLTVTTEAVDDAPDGYTTSYRYDAEGNQITVTDNRGKDTTFAYTDTGLIKTETNAIKQVTQYNYDKNLNVLSIVAGFQFKDDESFKRQIVQFTYDDEDQVIKVREKTSDAGDDTNQGDKWSETEYSYDTTGTIASITDGNDKVTTFEYDGNNRLIREILPEKGLDEEGNLVNYTVDHVFDAFGNEVETIDGNNNKTTYAFDRDNRTTTVTDANNVTTKYVYDENDNVTRIVINGPDTDVAQVTTYVYDKFNQLIAEVDGVGNALATSNEPLYQKIRVELGFDAEAPPAGPDGKVDRDDLRDLYTTSYTYDKVGNNLTAQDNELRKTDFEYDNLNRLVLRTDAEGGTREYRYDGNNNLTSLTELVSKATLVSDEKSRETKFQYDDNNRLTRVVSPLGDRTKLAYDDFDNLIKTSLSGRATVYEYDLRNLLVKESILANKKREISYDYDPVGNRIAVTDARNNKTEYVYDALNRNIEILDRRDLSTKFVYDGAGNQLKIIDPRSGVTEFNYDPGNRLIGFIDAEGRETSYQYDALDNQIVQTTAVGILGAGSQGEEVTTFKYDVENNLREIVDAKNQSTTFGFDRVYNETEVVDARGNKSLTRFDALNRVVEFENAKGETRKFTYDSVGNRLTEEDEGKRTTAYTFDDNDQLLVVRGPDGVETHYKSNPFGEYVSITRAANTDLASTKRFEYNKVGGLVKEYDLAPGTGDQPFDANTAPFVKYTYDKNNNIASKIDQDGRKTNYKYNENDQLISIKDPAATDSFGTNAPRGITSFNYDGNGNRNYVKDANGNVTRTYYNANNEVALVVDALGYATGTSYDENGNIAETIRFATKVVLPTDNGTTPETPPVVNPNSQSDSTIKFEYDVINQLTKRIDAEGFDQEYQYDAVGNVTVIKEQTAAAKSNTTRYAYDDLNRLQTVTDNYNNFEKYGYDAVGNKISARDKNGNVTSFTYDVNDRLLTIDKPIPTADTDDGADPEDRLQVFTYDVVGNLRSEKDENNGVTLYEYDALDRVVKIENSSGDFIGYKYDIVGNQTEVTDEKWNRNELDANGNRLGNKTDYEYDELNRIIKQRQAVGSDEQYVERYGYDRFGNEIATIEENVDEAGNLVRATTSYVYDDLNRLEQRQDAEDGALEIRYDAFGNQRSIKDESGVVTEYTYDRNDRLETIVEADSNSNGVKETTTIAYDGAGNEISRTDQRGNTTVYEYDQLNRLVTEREPEGGTNVTAYDAVGNVIAVENQNDNSFYVQYDENNRRTAVLTREGFLTTFEYDNVGNETVVSEYDGRYALAGDGSIPSPKSGDTPRVTENTYNALNQLESTTEPGGLITSFSYDAVGNLVEIMETEPPVASALVAAADGDTPEAAAAAAPQGKVREKVSYNKKNQVISREDANGVVTRLVLDKKGNVKRETEAFGTADARTTTYKYDKLDRLREETRPKTQAQQDAGQAATKISYGYDKSDRLTSRTTSGDNVVNERRERFEYDDNGRLELEVNGVDSRTRYAYDEAGNVTRIIFAEGTSAEYTDRFEYDENDRLTAEIDGEGVRTEYDYDDRGNKIETRQGLNEAGTRYLDLERVTTYVYDDQDRLIQITNPEDGVTKYYPDAKGNHSIIEGADGTITVNTFDDDGRIETNIVGRGSVAPTSADGFAKATITSDGGGIKTENHYEDGNVVSTTVGYANLAADSVELRVTRYEYDDLDQLKKIIDPEGFSSLFAYDAFGNQISVTVGVYDVATDDPAFVADKADRAAPQTTTFEFDEADQLIGTIDGNGNAASSGYDAHGNQVRFVSGIATGNSDDIENRSEINYRYDADGKLISKRTAAGGEVNITRNALGQETALSTLQSDSVTLSERTEYDSLGRVTAEIDATNIRTEYVYDAVGNLITFTRDAGGSDQRVTRYQYDANRNLLRQTNPVASSYLAYSYDSLGNLLTTTDSNGAVTRSYYNEYSQVIATVDAQGYFTEFELDVSGNALSTRIYAQALAATPGTALPTAPAGSLDDRFVNQTFDKNGKRTSETAADGSVKLYEFDSVGLLRQQTDSAATDSEARGRTTSLDDKVISWDWDAAGRLVGFTGVDGVVETYGYDAAGNKTLEQVSNPTTLATGGLETDTEIIFIFDANNRVVEQQRGVFSEQLEYDKAGNVIRKTDSNGNVSETSYDRNNRISRVEDALGEAILYGYDNVGNLNSVTDAEGNTSTIVYDGNDRVVEERGALTELYTLSPGGVLDATTGQSIVVKVYDGAGNLTQSTDASGFSVTRWYDDRNQVIAEVDGDKVLRKYTYNAFGEVEATLTDKNRVAGNPGPQSSVPIQSDDTATITNEFDVMGNVIRTVLPSIDTTTLTGSGASISATLNANQTMQDLSLYDAWGNLVESVDRMGNSSFIFVDLGGRPVAAVDNAGYLVETSYDSQGNTVKQVKYENALAQGSVVAGTQYSLPEGDAYAVDKYYNAEGRLEREVSAPVQIFDYPGGASIVSVTTSYTYDDAGNLKTRTLADGSSQAQTEYYFYDAADQRSHVVTSDGVLATFAYDGNGSLTEQRRYVNRVVIQGDLPPNPPASNAGDQTKTFQYNEVNLLSRETTVMNGASDIVTTYGYDASGNLVEKVEDAVAGGEEITSLLGYDAAGRINITIAPNGSESSVEYNVYGLKTRATTGGDPDAQAPAINSGTVTSALSNGLDAALTVSWTLADSGSGLTSWVAWDTSSKGGASVADLTASTPGNSEAPGSAYSFGSDASTDGMTATVPFEGLAAGTLVYFRVMIRDSLGNVSWSQEQSVVVPTYVQQVFVKETGTDQYVVEARFNGSVNTPVLVGESDVAMTWNATTERWSAALPGSITDPGAYNVGFKWGASGQYTTDRQPLLVAASNPRDGDVGWVLWDMPSDDVALVGNDTLVVIEGLVASGDGLTFRSQGPVLQQQLAVDASANNYDLYYGNVTAEQHTLSVAFQDSQDRVIANVVNQAPVKIGGTDEEPVFETTATWTEQYVSDAGETIATSVSVALQPGETGRVAANTMKLAYRDVSADPFVDAAFATVDMTADGDLFSSSMVELESGSTVDLKVFYVDTNGKEVIVQLQRISVPDEVADGAEVPQSKTIAGSTPPVPADYPVTDAVNIVSISGTTFDPANSFVVFASELDGRITNNDGDARAFSAGRFSGPVDASVLTNVIDVNAQSGAAGKSLPFSQQDYGNRAYFTEIEYNDLGIKTASNEDDGLWREYGVDANGNEVETRLLGEDRHSNTSIDTYARFDRRNLEIETVGPEATSGGVNAAAVTTTTYDYASRITSIDDPGAGSARTYNYDGIGNLISESDALGGITSYYYDRLGNLVRSVDQVGDAEVFRYSYSGNNAGRLTSTYFEGEESRSTVSFGYDTFGRRTSMSRGNETKTVSYDQKNRVKTVTDASNYTTEYWYDNRGNQVLVKDANGKFFGRAYNEMGLVTHEFANLPSSADQALAAMDVYVAGTGTLDPALSLILPSLVVSETQYDIFSNRILTIDPSGVQQSFTYAKFGKLQQAGETKYRYDEYGRQNREFVVGGKDIRRSYDDARRLTRIDDVGYSGTEGPTVTSVYTYDISGNRLTELLTVGPTTERNQAYTYDTKNQLLSWTDSAVNGPGNTESYTYYGDGNLRTLTNLDGTATHTFDAANRIVGVSGGGRSTSYSYDSAGRRVTEGSTLYTYKSNGWLATAVSGNDTYSWDYDSVGNVTTIKKNNVTKKTNSYDYAYRVNYSVSYGEETQRTTTTFSRSGKVTNTRVVSGSGDDQKTFNYLHGYDGQGREIFISGGGGGDGAAGSSVSSYDRNGRLSSVNLGVGDVPEDGPTPTSSKSFVYDNDGKIYRAVSNGTDGGTFNYLYANGGSVGEYKSTSKTASDVESTKLNQGNYATLREISAGLEGLPAAFPQTSIIQHTVAAGDTLRSIADQYYGSPDLWYVIADANGLTGKEVLQVGSRLVVPNTVANAYQTDETHTLYKEGDIVGSTLPNLKTPPPEEDECAKITAIILVVVVSIAAIALTVVTVGAAAPAAVAAIAGASAGLAATIAISVAVGVVVGAAIAFAASALTQVILVEFGLQEKFDWNAVAADTVAGAFGGAAAGLGAAVSTATKVTTLLRVANIAGQVALDSAGELASQAIQNDGQITNWALVGVAGAGAALGAIGDVGKRGVQVAKQGDAVASAAKTIGSVENVAEVARLAGKGKFGVFKDVFVSQIKKQSGGTFKQFIGKGTDEKISRIITKTNGVATESFSVVARQSSAGTSIFEGATKSAKLANTANAVAGKAVTGTKVLAGIVAAPVAVVASPFVALASKFGNKTATSAIDAARVGLKEASATAKLALKGASASASKAFGDAGSAIGSGLTTVKNSSVASVVTTGAKVVGGVAAAPAALVASPIVALAAKFGNKTAKGALESASATARVAIKSAGKTIGDGIGRVGDAITDARSSVGRSFTSAKNAASDAISNAIDSVKNFSFKEAARSALKSETAGAITDLFKGKSTKRLDLLGNQTAKFLGNGSDVLGIVEDGIPGVVSGVRTDKEGKSLFSTSAIMRKGGYNSGLVTGLNKVTTFAKPFAPLGAYLSSTARGEVYSNREAFKSLQRVNITEDDNANIFKTTFVDNNALATLGDVHARQHNYIALEWRAVAGNTTTQILSPFAIDRAASVDTLQTSNKLVAGEVWDFDQESIVTFAEGSVGGVGGDPGKRPGSFG